MLIYGNYQKAYSILAKCLIYLGKNEEAIQVINKGLSIKPNKNILQLLKKLDVKYFNLVNKI